MAIREETEVKNVDLGLPVLFDGERNIVISNDKSIDYPVGGVITEYMRLVPEELMPVIMSFNNLKEEATPESLGRFLDDFEGKMEKSYEPVISIMVCVEMFNFINDWFKAERQGLGEEYLHEILKNANKNSIYEFIFADSGYEGLGKSTTFQMILSAYAYFSMTYVLTKYTFEQIIKCLTNEEDVNDNAIVLLSYLYTEMLDMQHIDFRIVNTINGFESLYTIKSSMSLLAFEFAHCIENKVQFVKCANCGQLFVPDGRSDQIYCKYPSPQNAKKTCREVGAQVTRANKEKNDVVTREYRRVYIRYKMNAKRHPRDHEVIQKLDELTSKVKVWRKKLDDGTVTTEQFLEWLSQF